MKKILLSFFMCMLAIIGMQADSYVKVTTAPSDWSGDYLIVYEAGNVAFNGALTTLDAVSNTIDVTITDGEIAADATTNAAKFTIAKDGSNYTIKSASGYYVGQTSNANGLKASPSTSYSNTLTINDDASVNITAGGAYLRYNSNKDQLRFRYFKSDTYTKQKAIALYKFTAEQPGEGGGDEPVIEKLAAPSITPESCTFDESVNVTIANNADGATVYYSLNGGEFAEYTVPLTVTETTTVSAKAVKDEVESEVVSATYTKLASYANIAAFIDAAPAQEAILAGAVTVTYQNGDNLYVKDETGSILIYKATGMFNSGDKLTGIRGKYTLYKGLPEIENATLPEAVAGDAVEPVVMTADEVKALTAKDYSSYVKLENVEVTASTIADINLYNKFDVTLNKGADCTVVGIVTYYNALQIYPISIEVNESGEDPVDPTPDPTEPVYGWVLVEDASTLAVGDKVVIAAKENNLALSTTQNKNNRGAATITKSGNTITFDDDTQIITLEQGTENGTFAFFVEGTATGYLYAAGANSNNYLKTKEDKDAKGSWKISIDNENNASIEAVDDIEKRFIRKNTQSEMFSCYAEGSQSNIVLYRYCDANITAGMYYLVPGKWENEDLALYGVKFVNVSTGEYKWVQGYLNDHFVYFQLKEGEGEYTHMAFYCIDNKSEYVDENKDDITTANKINDWTAIEVLDKTPLLTYAAPGADKIMRYNVDKSKWEEVEIGTGVNRVEMAGGIGYAYGVVSAEGAIEVYNVNGAVVARGNDTIDLRGLGRGVYIIRNGNQVRKVVR